MFGWFLFQNIGFELADEKLVLPFVYSTPGGSALFANLLAPAVKIAHIFVQFSNATTRQLFLFADHITPQRVPVLFLLTAFVIGIGNGFGSLTYQGMLGYPFYTFQPKRPALHIKYSGECADRHRRTCVRGIIGRCQPPLKKNDPTAFRSKILP